MLLIDKTGKVFDETEITRGTLIFAKHLTWDAGLSGIVTQVTENEIRVQYLPQIRNVMNHFFVKSDEVQRGEWFIRYSNDGLLTTKTYPVLQE